MAAIFEDVFKKQISPDVVLEWIVGNVANIPEATRNILDKHNQSQLEFVPYFLNFLRDQSLHLVQGSRSTSTTPAKTPTNLKPTRSSQCKRNTDDSSHGRRKTDTTKQKPNRVELFPTQASDECSTEGISHNLSDCLSNGDLSQSSISIDSLLETSRVSFYGKKQKEKTPKQHGNTPTPAHSRSKRRSLGDFFQSPDAEQQIRKKNVPHSKIVASESSPNLGCRPNQKAASTEKRRGNRLSLENRPENSTKESPAESKDRLLGLPEGVQVITTSRRITTTLLPTSSQTSNVSSPFTSSHISSQSAQNLPRSVWAQPPEVLRKNIIEGRKTPTSKEATAAQSGKKPRRVATKLVPAAKEEKASVWTMPSPVERIFTQDERRTSTPKDKGKVSTSEECYPRTMSLTSFTQHASPSQCAQSSPVKTPVKGSLLLADTPTKTLLERLSAETVTAKPEDVTRAESLDILVQLYAGIIARHLVPNLTVEMYFIIQLLTAKNGDLDITCDLNLDQDPDSVAYFSSVHNAVYFAVSTLNSHRSLLRLLDKSGLHLLADCQRVADFSPQLKTFVTILHEQCSPKPSVCTLPSPIGGVSFQADTDNRKNFPNDRSFHAFKKQRDGFYELLREWEEHHLTGGWSMLEAQGARIRELVNRDSHLANHLHLSRLFQSQLIQMCKGDVHLQTEDENNIALLCHLKQTNPDKLKRLQERLITPSSVGGPCPAPSFPGCQEFFRDFLVASSNSILHHHLTNSMTAKVSQLNSSSFATVEAAGDDISCQTVDSEEQDLLLTCLLTLKLLGKFLGLLTFLPYHHPEHLPESMQHQVVDMRNQSGVVLDVAGLVCGAERSGRLCLTVPWVVDFLSMMDALAPKLSYFSQLFSHLLLIHRRCCAVFEDTGSHAMLLIITTLGWLFQLPVFPEGLYFTQTSQYIPPQKTPVMPLDELQLVDHHILHAVCPYLGEIRGLLVDFTVGLTNKHTSVKKITPVMAERSPTSLSPSAKNLQIQLEENFFHQHPASLRHTVDFVADRVASNHIKYFRAHLLPGLQTEAAHKARSLADTLNSSPDRNKNAHRSKIDAYAVEFVRKSRERSSEVAEKYCKEKTSLILRELLPVDSSEQVLSVAAGISCRTAHEKISAWLTAHITTNFFKRDMDNAFAKQMKTQQLQESSEAAAEVGLTKTVTVTTTVATHRYGGGLYVEGVEVFLSEVLHEFKALVYNVVGGTMKDWSHLVKEVCHVRQALTDARHQLPSARSAILKLSQELLLSIILQFPTRWSPELQTEIISLWHNELRSEWTFSVMFCPKHLHLMKISPDPQLSQRLWMDLVRSLVNSGLLTPSQLLHPQSLHLAAQSLDIAFICECLVNATSKSLASSGESSDLLHYIDSLQAACDKLDQPAEVQCSVNECVNDMRTLCEYRSINFCHSLLRKFSDSFVESVMTEALEDLHLINFVS